MDWSKYFKYNPDTGVVTRLISTASNTRAGDVVGCPHTGRYLKIGFKGKYYLLHRVIWELVYQVKLGESDFIDHINHNGMDNRLANLRLVTSQGNCRNKRMSKYNTSGVNGVCKSKSGYSAYVTVSGKYVFLGTFKTVEAAAVARLEAETKLGFHPNHGNN